MALQETSNHSLNTYDQGDDSWEHSTDMQTIEERLVIRDTDANTSNYTPHSGALYLATDTGEVYEGDGSAWNAMAFINDGDGVQRDIYVSSDGTIPSGASDNDIVLTENT